MHKNIYMDSMLIENPEKMGNELIWMFEGHDTGPIQQVEQKENVLHTGKFQYKGDKYTIIIVGNRRSKTLPKTFDALSKSFWQMKIYKQAKLVKGAMGNVE